GGEALAQISGSVDWEQRTFAVPAGAQELKWKFKDHGTNGQDRGWREEVRRAGEPIRITSQPASRSVDAGTTVRFRVNATGTPPLSYQWQFNGVGLTNGGSVRGATTASLTLTNVQPAQAGNYTVVVSNADSSVTSSNALLTVTPILPLAEALDTPGWVWTTSDSAPWVGQPTVTHDGVDAARSGAAGDDAASSLRTKVTGPGTVSFWWKVSSETNNDSLRFYVGDSEQARISGEVDWEQRTFAVPTGSQELKWKFKDRGTTGQDRGWVDQVRFAGVPPTITRQPASRSVDAGTTVRIKVKAAGTPPLYYQWQFNGVGLTNGGSASGATTASLTLTNVLPAQAGNYTVVVSNAVGSVTSSNALLTVTPVLPLAEALDTPGWVWTTSDSAPWVGQATVTHDGVDAARSGASGDDESSSLRTKVTGPGTVSFWWKVSSETNNDSLRFYVGDSEQARISGDVDWEQRTFAVPAGTQELKWKFRNRGTTGQDRGWVDQVRFAAVLPTITRQPASRSVDAGTTVRFKVEAAGTPPLSYQWQFNGVGLTNGSSARGATTASLTLTNVQPAQAGNYTVVVSNAAGSVTSSNALLTVTPILPLAEALDTPGWVWTTSDSAPWVGQPTVTHDGVDAARSGAAGDDESSSLRTKVTGPGTVSFWWKVSSETNNDSLRFYVGDSEQARISGDVDWEQRTFAVPSGAQELKWKFKDRGTTGHDRGWVDQVRFAAVPPTITNQPASRSVDAGTTVRFKVSVTGTPPLSYQWQFNGVGLTNGSSARGATTASLTLTNVQP